MKIQPEERLVAVRYIDRFKNQYYDIKVYTVYYDEGTPISYSDDVPRRYDCQVYNSSISVFDPFRTPEYCQDIVDTYIKNAQLNREKLNKIIDNNIAACSKPILIFPDDFKDYTNAIL